MVQFLLFSSLLGLLLSGVTDGAATYSTAAKSCKNPIVRREWYRHQSAHCLPPRLTRTYIGASSQLLKRAITSPPSNVFNASPQKWRTNYQAPALVLKTFKALTFFQQITSTLWAISSHGIATWWPHTRASSEAAADTRERSHTGIGPKMLLPILLSSQAQSSTQLLVLVGTGLLLKTPIQRLPRFPGGREAAVLKMGRSKIWCSTLGLWRISQRIRIVWPGISAR